jgi:PleD family two-component response regulator
VDLQVSIGVGSLADSEQQKDLVKELLARADQALYKAKEGGRDRVEGFE